MSSTRLPGRFTRLWIARVTAGAMFAALGLGVIVSCQDGRRGAPVAASASGDGARSAASRMPTTTDSTYGAPTTQEWQAMGFRYPPSPGPQFRGDGDVVKAENASCVVCHTSDNLTMHPGRAEGLSCVDCHGGTRTPIAGKDPERVKDLGHKDARYLAVKNAYHVQPTLPKLWEDPQGHQTAANPGPPASKVLAEDVNFIRFVNPGDLRAARMSCGACHNQQTNPIVSNVQKNIMTHGALLWEAALYNNGSINRKIAVYGEEYVAVKGPDGKSHAYPARVRATSQPTAEETKFYGWLGELWPLPRWEISQPGNILRVFERGARIRPIIGEADPEEDPGRPDVKLSLRGFGTEVRTDPVNIGLQKTRLLDPTLNFPGTNDHPGDYRASGCSACHVLYANDRSPVHSGRMAAFAERFKAGSEPFKTGVNVGEFGNRGESFSSDTTVNPTATSQPIAADALFDPNRKASESGHPIAHAFVQNMPTSTCIVCHVHPGTNVLNSYTGFMWWDNETDGQFMYPKHQKYPTSDEEREVNNHNPEGAAVRGLWSNMYPNDESQAGLKAGANFLENVVNLNPLLPHIQFGDFHGHGWVFRAVFKQDRHGNLLNADGQVLDQQTGPAVRAPAVSFQTQPFILKSDFDPSDDDGAAEAAKQLRKTEFAKAPATQAVHMKDIHLEKGMQCVDCHFEADNHGTGHLIGETRAAVTIDCIDCHGTASSPPVILRYLTSKKSDEKKALVRRAFTGTAATQPSDDQLKMWEDSIKAHFTKVDANDGPVLFQISALSIGGKQKTGWFVKTADGTAGDKPRPIFAWDPKDKDAKADQQHYASAHYAHTIRKLDPNVNGGKPTYGFTKDELKANSKRKWNDVAMWDDAARSEQANFAHANGSVSCYACHSAWNTSCFGCHLPQRANQNKPMLHNEGIQTRNYTNYNYQTLRDDVYMLGVDATTRDHKVVPVRSACAVMVSSQDALRQWIYTQQQTVSAEGFAGTAFSPYFPHTVRTAETKQCTDCHLSKDNDNNAVMAQLLMQGTNSVNFIGRYSWVAEGKEGLEAVAVAERDEPQAVIGSKLHKLAYPDWYAEHQKRGMNLAEAEEHDGTVYDVQLRGEYLYAACGKDGFIAYDVANIDNKGFSEKIITAPVSPLGQRFYVRTKFATSVCSPSTLALDPTRKHHPENEEVYATEIGTKDQPAIDPTTGKPTVQGVHLLYAFLYVTDREEGLVVVGNRPDSEAAKKYGPGVATLLDGDPDNNFLTKALSYNPGGILTGARHMALYGHYAYISCNAGVVVVDLDNPLAPKVTKVLGSTAVRDPRKVAFQFRYAFVADADGLKVLNVTDPADPKPVPNAVLPIADARDVYVCRTFGYVAAGKDGLIIVDLENPEALRPESISDAPFDPAEFRKLPGDRARRAMRFNAYGHLGDSNAVRVGMTNNSLFAYVADGRNGLKVLQLTSDETPGFTGFSPTPVPKLIAQRETRGPALSLSKGLDRDRAVDESGHQLSVFGRRGARPFTLEEQRTLYLPPRSDPKLPRDPQAEPYRVSNNPADSTDINKVPARTAMK